MNQSEFLNQKREAVERMREMNARATGGGYNNRGQQSAFVNNTKGSAKQAEPSANAHFHESEKQRHDTIKNQKSASHSMLGIPFIDNLLGDSDLTLIIGLLLVLMSENADKRLLFALIYILI